jgi:hypothetical protein
MCTRQSASEVSSGIQNRLSLCTSLVKVSGCAAWGKLTVADYVQMRTFVWDTYTARLAMPQDTASVGVVDGGTSFQTSRDCKAEYR